MSTEDESRSLARLAPSRAAVGPWLGQRLSAAVLLVLLPWVVLELAALEAASAAALRAWAGQPGHAAALAALFLAAWYHAVLGLEVVVQDYVRPEWFAALLVLALRLAGLVAALVSVAALVRLLLVLA